MKARWVEILFNCIKLICAALVAMGIAQLLHLEFVASAGVISLLTIMPTKKETLKTAGIRFLAFAVAMVLALICYTVAGFHILAFALFLIIFIPVCQVCKWNYAMTICSVVASHFLILGDMSVANILNEVLIFSIGVGTGILANLHLRKDVGYI